MIAIDTVLGGRLPSCCRSREGGCLSAPDQHRSLRCGQCSGGRRRFLRSGRAGHPARPNFGDCLSYAVAKVMRCRFSTRATISPRRTCRPAVAARDAVPRPIPAGRREGRLGPAGGSRARAAESRLARGARRGYRRAACRATSTCWWCRPGAIALGRTVLGFALGAAAARGEPGGGGRRADRAGAHLVGDAGAARHHRRADPGDAPTPRNAAVTSTRARPCSKLWELRAVPVVNENDTVATNEIRYGDNDRLAARVATMAGADLLVLFSDVDGLYTAPPASDPVPGTSRWCATSPRDRGDGGRRRVGAVAGRDADEDRRRQDRDVGGTHMVIADGRGEEPAGASSRGRPLHLVPDALPRGRAEKLDRRRRWSREAL